MQIFIYCKVTAKSQRLHLRASQTSHNTSLAWLEIQPSFIPTAYEDGTVFSETSEYKIQRPGNYPEISIRHSEHGVNLKSRKLIASLLKISSKFDKFAKIQC